MIVDAQVHLWLPDTPENPWPPNTHSFAQGPEMAPERMIELMDEAGVDRAVVVPPSWSGDSNDYCAEAARAHPDRFRVMGRVPLQSPLSADGLRAWCDENELLGLRLTFSRGASRQWLEDGTADWIWGAAESLGIPLYVYAPGQLGQMDRVLERFPGLRIALDHLALHTDWRDDEIMGPMRQITRLARHPNLSVKASSMPSYVTEEYPFPSLHEPLRRVIDAFGAQRVFWGSDVTRLPVPYRDCVRLVGEGLDYLDDDQRRLILGDALNTWIGWPEDEQGA